jgi:hypothetical protein
MNLKSPIFGEVGSYSYPFKLPNTPRNATLLGFRHRVENITDLYHDEKGIFLWNSLNLFQGTVRLKTLTTKAFEGSLFEGVGDFFYERKNASLQDVNFGEMIFEDDTDKFSFINSCTNSVYPAKDMSFPNILNKSYFEELPVNEGLHYFNVYINSLIPKVFSGGSVRTIVVPMLYIRFVLKKIFEHLKYTFDDTFFSSDSDFNSLALFNLVDCNSGTYGYFIYDDLKIYLNYHVPRISFSDFFLGLETFFNIRFFINNATGIVKLLSIDNIINSNDYIEFSKQVISVVTEIEDRITGYHLKMTVETNDDNYAFKKEQDELHLGRLKESVQSLSDLNPWPSDDIMDQRWVIDENCYYILWSNKLWVQWYENIDLYMEYVYRTRQEVIETKFSTLLNYNDGDYAIIGNARVDWKTVTGKIFFTKFNDNGSTDNVIAIPTTDNNSLYWGGENGLFNKHYKAFLDFRMATKFVKIVKQMSYMELKEFDFSRKIMVNGIKYLVKNLQVTIKKDRIMPALLECYTCN